MTNQEINLRISEWFEPMPSFSKGLIAGMWWLSDKRAWTKGTAADAIPLPLDHLGDESANARLLDTAKISIEQLYGASEVHAYFAHPERVKWGMFKHPDRKTAVVMAFCKFAKINTGD